jgi:hypothetical protein
VAQFWQPLPEQVSQRPLLNGSLCQRSNLHDRRRSAPAPGLQAGTASIVVAARFEKEASLDEPVEPQNPPIPYTPDFASCLKHDLALLPSTPAINQPLIIVHKSRTGRVRKHASAGSARESCLLASQALRAKTLHSVLARESLFLAANPSLSDSCQNAYYLPETVHPVKKMDSPTTDDSAQRCHRQWGNWAGGLEALGKDTSKEALDQVQRLPTSQRRPHHARC